MAAALGSQALDGIGVLGAGFGSAGALTTSYGMTGAAVHAWLRERRDLRALQPLWELVVAGVDRDLAFSPTSAYSSRLMNVRFMLHRRVIEILDGVRTVRPWIAEQPLHTVAELRRSGRFKVAEEDLESIITAVLLKDAVVRRREAGPGHGSRAEGPSAPSRPLVSLPGENTAAADERARLISVSRALNHPLTLAAQRLYSAELLPEPTAPAGRPGSLR